MFANGQNMNPLGNTDSMTLQEQPSYGSPVITSVDQQFLAQSLSKERTSSQIPNRDSLPVDSSVKPESNIQKLDTT